MSEPLQQVSDAEATIVLPTPGRRRNNLYKYAPPLERAAAPADLSALGGLNPLVAAANPILAVVPQIRHALRHPDPEVLRSRLHERLYDFDLAARAAGYPEERVYVARYALCALLDESAACTPWGEAWAASGLLAELHAEASGADKFFALLDKMMSEPRKFTDLLEFFYVCMALGFEGRYRGGEGGRLALGQLRTRLATLIAAQRGKAPEELSAHWQGASVATRHAPGTFLRLWALGSVCAALLVALYLGYGALLAEDSDAVATTLARLQPVPIAALGGSKVLPTPGTGAAAVAARLADDVASGFIAIRDEGASSTIVLNSDRLFASGSARLDPELQPLVLRIADALNEVPGAVLVTGHTDDRKIHSARFPSNWELSTERARSVAQLMAKRLRDPSRLRAEGLADSQPVAPNDSAANRARNRRVGIVLAPGR